MSEPVQTTITTGELRGSSADGVARYLGIPYAESPTGALRFRLPVRAAAWDGVREATEFGATAPQSPYTGRIGTLLPSVAIDGHNMLTANVWAPVNARNAPVVLWIHGGAFERGTAAIGLYDGTRFARDGIVFVSINYRLGSEGFSVFGAGEDNLGYLDCVAALEWVSREISAFGGDPARITVMGESAGGSLVAALASSKTARPLMHQAIIQSGPLRIQDRKKTEATTRQIAQRAAVAPRAAAFSELPAERLVAARTEQAAGGTPLGGPPGFQLTRDEWLPLSPHQALSGTDLPILIGTNTDEYRLWFSDEQLSTISALKLAVVRLALRISGRAFRAYRDAWPNAKRGELFGQLATDMMLRRDAIRLADSARETTHVYEFAWQSPIDDLRAAHALELGFVFNALETPDAKRMTGDAGPQHLADEMYGAWVAFITTGDPGWEAFGENRLTRVFDEASRTEPVRRSAALDQLPR